MVRISTYITCWVIIMLAGCKQIEPVDRPFFLAGWTELNPLTKSGQPTRPVLVFRTPGYGLWADESTHLEMGEEGTLVLAIGEVEVVEMPLGTHRVAVRPGRVGFEYCELDLVVKAGQPPPFVEVFERQNPSGKMISMVLAEVEAAMKFPVDPGMNCFGHFGVRQGVIPKGVSLDQAKSTVTQAD